MNFFVIVESPLAWKNKIVDKKIFIPTKSPNINSSSLTLQHQMISCLKTAVVFDGASSLNVNTGLILGLRPANERWRYFVTTSLIGWAQT